MIIKKGSISDDVIAGAITGVVARIITAPFDVLKIRFQLQKIETGVNGIDGTKYRSMIQAFSTIIREEGKHTTVAQACSICCLSHFTYTCLSLHSLIL